MYSWFINKHEKNDLFDLVLYWYQTIWKQYVLLQPSIFFNSQKICKKCDLTRPSTMILAPYGPFWNQLDPKMKIFKKWKELCQMFTKANSVLNFPMNCLFFGLFGPHRLISVHFGEKKWSRWTQKWKIFKKWIQCLLVFMKITRYLSSKPRLSLIRIKKFILWYIIVMWFHSGEIFFESIFKWFLVSLSLASIFLFISYYFPKKRETLQGLKNLINITKKNYEELCLVDILTLQ